MKREQFKDVEVNGRRFRIGRFDALTGSYITTLLLMQMLPMGLEDRIPGVSSKGKSIMDKETFMDIQRDCLKVVSELKPVGDSIAPMLVMLPDGRWGVMGIEDDTLIVITLTISVLAFNLSDFFQEGALSNLNQVLPGLTPSKATE